MIHKIEELRKECDITKAKMANILGLPSSTYSSYESGQQAMPAYVFSGICDYFDLSRDSVEIPNCPQKHKIKKAMGNTHEHTSYLYRKGFNAGYNSAKDKFKKQIDSL